VVPTEPLVDSPNEEPTGLAGKLAGKPDREPVEESTEKPGAELAKMTEEFAVKRAG
jgi:hypothetical protein